MADSSFDPSRKGEADGHDAMGSELAPGEVGAQVRPDPEPVAPETVVEPARTRRNRLRGPLLLLGLVILVVGAIAFYLHGGRYESTDDASLQAGQVSVASNVSGQVVGIEVHENQQVKAGQVLFRLDPAPYQAAVDEAAAQLADAKTQVGALQANFRQGQAEIQAANARLTYAVGEANRQRELLKEGISSQNQYDQAVLAVQTARQGIQTSTQQAESVRATLSGNVAGPVGAQPAVKRAQAALDRAKLNLGYTVVRASQDGIVTRVNQLQVGNYVSAAKPVFALVGTRIWVEAEFKENQLRYMRLGQPATVKVDAFPDQKLTAHISSFSPGTGNSFSLLPAENATGNWVKVVQRLPVQLDFDRLPQGIPLHAGLSAEVVVDTGHVRHLFGGSTSAVQPRRQ